MAVANLNGLAVIPCGTSDLQNAPRSPLDKIEALSYTLIVSVSVYHIHLRSHRLSAIPCGERILQ